MKAVAYYPTLSGTVNIHLDMPALMHIWPKVKIIIRNINQFMKLFLKILV